MEIQKINNSPSFQAIKISSKEGRKVAGILRNYQKTPTPALRQQLLDIFTPHIEKEAQLHNGILKQDFVQDLYVCLFENIGKVNTKYQPSAQLVNKLNEIKPTLNNYATMGLQSIEELTTTQKTGLIHQEELLKMYDAISHVKKSSLSPELKDILMAKLSGKTNIELAKERGVCEEAIRKRVILAIKTLTHKNKKEYQTPKVTNFGTYLENHPDLRLDFDNICLAHKLKLPANGHKQTYKVPRITTVEDFIASCPQEIQKTVRNRYTNFIENIKIAAEIKKQHAYSA